MKKIFGAAIIILTVTGAFAQDKSVVSYTLKEAIDFALNNNNAVKNAKLDEQKATAFNWEILTQGLPQANASLEYDYYFKTPIVPGLSQSFAAFLPPGSNVDLRHISFVLPNTVTSGLSVSQLLFDGRYMFGIKARKELSKTSRLQTGATEQEIRNTITKAYYQAEAAQEAKSLLTENDSVIAKLLRDTKATYAQGLIEELDVNRIELAQATLESQINYQNQMGEVALSNLKFQMGLPLSNQIILKDKLDDLKTQANISAENKFDAKNRLEYQLLETAIILKGYDMAQKRSGYYPSLGAFLNYGWNAQTNKFKDIFNETINPIQGNYNNWYQQGLVGIKLNVPIFDSGLKHAQVKQAKLEQMKTQNDFENFKQAAQLQFEVAQTGLNTALADEVISQKTLDLSKKIFGKNQIKFSNGVGSSFELEQSQQEYTTNLLKHIQSVLSVLTAKADLDKALGVK